MIDLSTCAKCSEDYPTDEMFWVDEEPGQPIGHYCYNCDSIYVIGDHDGEAELYCTFCNDNQLSCGACDDSYEGN